MMVVEMGRRFIFLTLGLVSLLALGACSGDNNSSTAPIAQAGTVSGRVVSSVNSTPVKGATVTTKDGTTTTATDGTFSVPTPAGDRSVVQVEADGFAEAFPVARVTEGQTTNLRVTLVRAGAPVSVSVASGETVSAPNSAQVIIPANGLVPEAGGPPAGSVNVSLTPINPAVDPSLMPGGFNGVSAGGGTAQPIESFGALLVDVRDSARNRYTLAPGKTATIRIPLGTQSTNPPATMPLWFFDEAAGVWQEEGTATLRGTGSDRYYEGAVTRFRYWNADMVLDSIAVTGCVKDANGQPVANALVETKGINYTGTAFDSTAADGTFSVAMRKNSQANLAVVDFDPQTFARVPVSNVVTVGPSTTDIALADCLVKKASPLAITTAALPPGTVGLSYSQILTATGGVPGYVWTPNTGSTPLPDGLMLNQAGMIVGTPTTAGTKAITVKVTDQAGATAIKTFTLTIIKPSVQPLAITTSTLHAGAIGVAYNATLEATGGTGTKSWSIAGLPAGLKLNAATGAISGTPTSAGTSRFTVHVQDSDTPPQSAERPLTITIISSGGGGGTGGGTLTVSNAPPSVGGRFTGTVSKQTSQEVDWEESSGSHIEGFTFFLHNLPGLTYQLIFVFADPSNPVFGEWSCTFPALPGFLNACTGVTISQAGGTITLTDTVLSDVGQSGPPITLNGTLTFTPF